MNVNLKAFYAFFEHIYFFRYQKWLFQTHPPTKYVKFQIFFNPFQMLTLQVGGGLLMPALNKNGNFSTF